MQLNHAKTNIVPDFTGTVTVYNQTGGSQTIAATDLVRPSDWNSQHVMRLTFTGNTTGQSTLSGTNIPIAGAGGVSIGNSNGSWVISGLTDPGWLTTAQPPGAYLTTAAMSNHSHNFATTTTNGALIVVGTTNSAGATIGVPAFLTTAQPVGAYLTTARASNDAVGLNTALTANGVAWTVNSSGLSLNVPAFLTTAAQSGHSHGNPQLNLTNLSGTTASNSAGFTLSLSAGNYLTTAAASDHSHGNPTLALTNLTGTTASNSAGFTLSLSGAGGGVINQTGPNIADSAATITNGTVVFSNLNGVSFGLAGSTMTASHNGLTTAAQSDHSHGNPTLALTNLSGTTGSASNGLTISLSAAAPGAGGGITLSYFNPQDAYVQVAGQQGQGTLHVQPAQFPNVQFDRLVVPLIFSNATNSSGSQTLSLWMGIYTRNDSTLSLASSTSYSTAITASGTVGAYSSYGGMRLVTIGSTNTITEGQYWVGIVSRTTSGGANATISQVLASQMNSNFSGVFGETSNASHQYTRGLGIYSATTSGMPNSIAYSQLRGTASVVLRQPLFYVVSGTI